MESQRILVGVCGGVAAYKALPVVSALRKQGHTVRVVMTEAASRFVQPASFAAVSGAPVLQDMWPDSPGESLEEQYPHLYPATQADLFLLIPATANSLAKIASGAGSDLLSTSCLSLPAHCRKIFCPAMNVEMWHNSFVQENVQKLEAAGWQRLGPASGALACGMTGEGRLMEPDDVLAAVAETLQATRPLAGKTVLILSGPTREHIDPIRFIGNPSSGLMGKALAEAAVQQGADVILVSGPVPEDHLPHASCCRVVPVVGAMEMLEASRQELPHADAILYVAAVADYRPETCSQEKAPKASEPFDLRLVPNPDLAATLNAEKPSHTFTIGFALQTHEGEEQARKKLAAKSLDGIVLNYPDSMGSLQGRFQYLSATSDAFENWGPLSKTGAAQRILRHIPIQETP